MAFANVTTEVVDAVSGRGALIDDNSQDFDVCLDNGSEYSFAVKLDIGPAAAFADCETPEDIERTVRDILTSGNVSIEVVVAAHPMDY